MEDNNRSPALVLALAFSLGIVVGIYTDPSFSLLIVLPILLLTLSALFYRIKRSLLFSICSLVLLVILGLFRHEIQTRVHRKDSIIHAQQGTVFDGIIISQPENAGRGIRFVVRTKKAGGEPVSGKIMAYYYGDKEFDYGDVVRIDAQLSAPRQATNFYAFDFRQYLARRGIYRTAYIHEGQIEKTGHSAGSHLRRYVVFPIRRHIEYVIHNTLKGDMAGFLEGIILGGSGKMNPDTRQKFVEVGVVHILAVSGLHVGIIALLFYTLFISILHLKKRWATVLTIVILALFALITDMRPSVVRASLMVSLALSAQVFGRKPQPLNSMGFAALILLIANPTQILDLGFQLSFGAAFGIIYLYPRMMEMMPKKWQESRSFWAKYLLQASLISVCAQLGTFPIIVLNFHRVPLLSVVANLFVVPLVGFAIPIGLLMIFAGVFSIGLAKVFAGANWIFLRAIIGIVELFSRLDFASVAFPYFGAGFALIFYTILIFGINSKRNLFYRRIFIALILAVPLIWSGYKVFIEKPTLWVVFLDVGQGDSVFIRYPNGRTMLIDAGATNSFQYVIQPFVMAQGRQSVDDIVLTHAHYDHFGGFIPLLENMTVDKFSASFAKSSGVLYNELLESARGVKFDTVRTGDTLTGIYPVSGRFLWVDSTAIDPEGNSAISANNLSLVLMLQYGDAAFLFTGDAEYPVENILVRRHGAELASDIYKAGHHGSQTSNTGEFMRAVSPQMAVVSVGDRNRFNHPSQSVINRFDSLGTKVYRTDMDGAIWIRTDGNRVWVRTRLGRRFSFLALK